MWPWEHLAAGYLAYAVLTRVTWRERPTTTVALALAFGTQFPDLVDKPLSWWLGVLPSGTTLAHSLLTAIPICVTVVALGVALEKSRPAVAFAVGYLSHLPGDVVYPVVLDGEPKTWFLLWPLRQAPGAGPSAPLGHLTGLVAQFLEFLATPLGAAYLVGELLLLTVAVWIWVRDGRPGLDWRPNPA